MCYQIKYFCLIKHLKKDQGGCVQTEPHQRDQVISLEIYIVRQLFHNRPVVLFIPSRKYHQGYKEDESAGKWRYSSGYVQVKSVWI